MTLRETGRILFSGLILTAFTGGILRAEESFYTRPAMFSTRPNAKKSPVINRFGPVGLGIQLTQPAFGMKIHHIEEGSPAAATGTLKAGQIIESINGETLHDIDPRIQLGRILAEAEGSDGNVTFVVRAKEGTPKQSVTVEIPVLGSYSNTWPLDDAKSDDIVRNFADYLAEKEWSGKIGLNGPEMLFLLSTGEEKDLDVVRKWVKKTVARNQNYGEGRHVYQWFVGWGAPPLAEYYLRTGDESVLPLLQRIADAVRKTMYRDGWGGRGIPGHHMGIAGTPTLTFLLLARQCGVDVDEDMLQRALQHYYRFAGRGVNPYMDARPESTFTDNGRCARLAHAMAAAAALGPEGENSVYARARDISALKSFYSTSYMLHGHTGGGIGEVWRSAAMGLLYDKKPTHYREFMQQRQWFYDLSRRYDGSFGILGGGSYDDTNWGAAMGLTYTVPRKNLSIFGAPRSEYAQYHEKIPVRPWGTAADDAFYSLEPAVNRQGKVRSLEDERVATDTGLPVDRKLRDPDISDDELRQYIYHPEHRFREVAAQAIYKYGRFHLIPELLNHPDPRVRNAGVMAIKVPRFSRGNWIAGFPQEKMTKEILDPLYRMLNDPNEAWFTVDRVLQVLSTRPAEELAPHTDRLIHFLEHDEWWLRQSALKALVSLAADARYYHNVLPAMERAIPNSIRGAVISPLGEYGKYADLLKEADPEVLKANCQMLGQVYLAYPGKRAVDPPGGLHPQAHQNFLSTVTEALARIPGGLDVLYKVAQKRYPNKKLAHRNLYLNMERLEKNPVAKEKALPVITHDMVLEHIGKNRGRLRELAAAEVQSRYPGGRKDKIEQLVTLLNKAGKHEYDWHMFSDMRRKQWWYHTFDPIPAEQMPWDKVTHWNRYRDVTLPDGMENWYALDFDPEKADWKRGKTPIGQYKGEIPENPAFGKCNENCVGPGSNCYGATPINTLWDKEVLLMRGTFKVPPLKEGRRYRLRVNQGQHVGLGSGYIVYVNGRKLIEFKGAVGRFGGHGGDPHGAFITQEFLDDFKSGEVTIAVKSFLRYGQRIAKPAKRIPRGKMSIHIDEQKLPPMGDDLVRKSATVVPMLTSEWQTLQGAESKSAGDGKLRYDGEPEANKQILGSWQFVERVSASEDFIPGKSDKPDRHNALFPAVTFKPKGQTDQKYFLWSGDMLMDVDRYQAMQMMVREIAGTEYLFIEEGGFSRKKGPDWKTPWCVFARK